MARSSPMIRATLGLPLLAVLYLAAPLTFVGTRVPSPRSSATQMQGYRLDWMLERKDGDAGLQTQDGYWVGEVGFEKSQAAQGLRYRMRPTPEEVKKGIETDGLMYQFGPVKIKLGEAFGGTGNNPGMRELKRKISREGVYDAKKKEENEFWLQRYGHKRWIEPYVDQSTGLGKSFLRGLAAWSAFDPLKEERGVTWFEADYGKPWLKKYVGFRIEGFVSAEQVAKEYATGKLLPEAPKEEEKKK